MRYRIGQVVALLRALFLLMAPMVPLLFMAGCSGKTLPVRQSNPLPVFGASQKPVDSFTYGSNSREDFGGVSKAKHFSIEWGPGKAETLDVLESTLSRMEHMQQTVSASDTNAKALFHVMQAIDILAGQEVKEIPQSIGVSESE